MVSRITVIQRESRETDAVEVAHEFVEADFGDAKRTPTIFALWQLSRKFDLAVQHANANLKAAGSAEPAHTTRSRFCARIAVATPDNGGEDVTTVDLPEASEADQDDYADRFLEAIRAGIREAQTQAGTEPENQP